MPELERPDIWGERKRIVFKRFLRVSFVSVLFVLSKERRDQTEGGTRLELFFFQTELITSSCKKSYMYGFFTDETKEFIISCVWE